MCRIVTDRETGKPKGFGFCEYKDVDTAKSAIRNLNKFDFKGRQLHVDSSDKAGGDVGGGASKPAPSQPLLPTQPTGQVYITISSLLCLDGIRRYRFCHSRNRRVFDRTVVRDEYVSQIMYHIHIQL